MDKYLDEILGARSSINSLTTVRPYHWRDNMIVGANCIPPLQKPGIFIGDRKALIHRPASGRGEAFGHNLSLKP